jgi:violaxanthin de-epoxidase
MLFSRRATLILAAGSALLAAEGFAPHSLTINRASITSTTTTSASYLRSPIALNNAQNDDNEFNNNNNNNNDLVSKLSKGFASAFLALTLSFNTFGNVTPSDFSFVQPANAADGKAIGLCLLQKCRLPLAKCIANPKCLANVICINTCNNAEDETGCQIKCGDIFENDVVGEFNKCAVSDMDCVPTRPDDGSYPEPAPEKLVQEFDTKLWNGRWYITAGQNDLFDVFPCQVHFFTESAPGKFFGKLNWRIEEPDGEFFTRDAMQRFVQDPKQPGHLINHDNEYLHYQDDWYVMDYAADDNKEGVPPFAFVYYRGANDAWVGYGGAVVYTRDSKLPPELIPRLREAAKKVNFDFDKDFKLTDNTCSAMEDGEAILKREQFAGKIALQTEEQIQAEAVRVRGNAVNGIKAQKMFVSNELSQAEKAFEVLGQKTLEFEKEVVNDAKLLEQEVVKDVVLLEKEVVKDVVLLEKEVVKDVVSLEKEVVKDVKLLEKEVVDVEKGVVESLRKK